MSAKINKYIFYILSFTWGLPMTLVGCFTALILMIVGYKPKRWGYCYCFEVGEQWGGCNLGVFFLTDKDSDDKIKNHELGHAIQNCYFGLLMPILVSIPSAIRYWYRIYQAKKIGYLFLKPYDSIWFEGQATKLGNEFVEWQDSLNKQIKVKYHNPNLVKIEKINKGDWIDLRAAEDTILKAGESKIISLGVSMKLPEGYEAHVVPRSSTFKKWGVIQTNHIGIIDNSYSGNNDIWGLSVYATRDTEIKTNDRICQFRIVENQPTLSIIEVERLDGDDRGGFGSTGVF